MLDFVEINDFLDDVMSDEEEEVYGVNKLRVALVSVNSI